jgi:peptidoglycan/LPS O-acetylase OafA/YrhL
VTVPSHTPAVTQTPLATRLRGLLSRGAINHADYPLGYVASFDGLRGLTTLGTMSAHTDLSFFGGAAVYMDVFFAMSGYLITSLLLNDYRRNGRISLKKFYLRRIVRLYPALMIMLIIFIVACCLFSTDLFRRLAEAGYAFFYLTDYWLGINYPIRGLYLAHTWSLAVEEQFYLLWPLTFILVLRLLRPSWRAVTAVFVLAVGFALWRIYLTYSGVPTRWLFFCFDAHADSLLAGCGTAIVLKLVDLRDYPRTSRVLAASLAPLFCFELACGLFVDLRLRWYYYALPLFGAIPALVCIGGLVQPDRTFMHRVYEHPVPVFIGRVCYGLYLYHWPIFLCVQEWAPPAHAQLVTLLVGWPLSFLAAAASYFLIERHFMRARPI